MKNLIIGILIGLFLVTGAILLALQLGKADAQVTSQQFIVQGFIVSYNTSTGIVESIGVDIQKPDGSTKTVVTVKPEIVGFFQKVTDVWLEK